MDESRTSDGGMHGRLSVQLQYETSSLGVFRVNNQVAFGIQHFWLGNIDSNGWKEFIYLYDVEFAYEIRDRIGYPYILDGIEEGTFQVTKATTLQDRPVAGYGGKDYHRSDYGGH